MKLFSVDSPIYKFMSQLYDILKLNILWLICSLPIVTFGASTTAAFYVALQMADDTEGYIAPAFFKSFKRNLKQGALMGIITLFECYVLWLDWQLYQASGKSAMILAFMILLAFFVVLSNIYAYALMARYDNTIKQTFQNSFVISIRYLIHTIVLIVIIALEVAIIYWNTTTQFIGFLIGPACIFLTISGYAGRHFRILEPQQNRDTDNGEINVPNMDDPDEPDHLL